MTGKKYPLKVFPCFELVTLFLHWQKVFPKKQRAGNTPNTWGKRDATTSSLIARIITPLTSFCLLHWRRGAQVFKEKREVSRGFSKLSFMEPHPYGLGTSWSLRSFIFGSYIHLTHDILYHTYHPIILNTISSPMGEKRKNCVAYPNSVKIILESIGGKVKLEARIHWKELSTLRHKGCSLSNDF